MADFPRPTQGIAVTHVIVSSDVGRSRRFDADTVGGEVLLEGEPTIVALANGWIIINVGGPPTDDKPTVTLERRSSCVLLKRRRARDRCVERSVSDISGV